MAREIWSLFPKFCNSPADSPDALLKPGSAKGLNSILESKSDNHAEIKSYVLSGLRKVAIFCSSNENKAYQQLIGKYAGNYLKTLLNLYRDDSDHQAAAMSTAREMVQITPAEKLTAYYQTAKEKAQSDDEEDKAIYWDIVVLIAPWLSAEQVEGIFTESLEMTKSDNPMMQKKAWRILEQIGSCENDQCKEVMKKSIQARSRKVFKMICEIYSRSVLDLFIANYDWNDGNIVILCRSG